MFILAIEKAQKRLYAYYTNKQFIRPEHDWPPYHFKYFTPLAIIYENIHTKPATATNTANVPVDQEYDNKTTEDINSLFSAYRGCISYKILIEGEPGIGKTILSSEIAAQWADHDKVLLKDKALLFLLFMRQPETKNISSVKSLVEHFFPDDTPLVNELTEWLVNSNGKHLTILLDGYDEASTYSAFYDFVNQLIAHRTLPECGLVITSRPAESSHLHDHVNCRAEILGFTELSRQKFIDLYVERQEKEKQIYQTNKLDVIEHNVKKKIEIIQKTLKCNPVINTLCYIPLNATMLLLCLTESEEEIDLPTTATTLYERFVIITMKRFLHSIPGFTDAILKFEDLPKEYYETFEQLSKFAFSVSIHMDDKKSMQLVFELADIENTCKNFVSHGNGLGLLKPASFLDMGIQNRYPSYNFLHKSIQEYMVAYHIASLPPKMLSDLLNRKFWDSSYFNVWIMYVGITRGEQKEFKHFLSGSRFKFLAPNPSRISDKILKDKIKCLHLLRCAAEVKESKFLESVQSAFEGKIIDISNNNLSETDIKTLAVLLLHLPDGPWTLNLSSCNINNEHCKVLFEIFSSQTVTANIQTVDISFNTISSENLYRLCHEIFKSWKTKEVILPIDALHNSVTMKRTKDFMDILENLIPTNRLSSGVLMISYQANQGIIIVVYSNLNYVKCFQLYVSDLNENVAKRLKILVMEELKSHRIGRVYFSYSMFKHHDVETLSYIVENFERIKFCGLNMHSKGAYLLDNTSKVDFQIEKAPSMCLVDFFAVILQNSVQVNPSPYYLSMLSEKVKEETKRNLRKVSTVKVLDLANNNISDCIADDIKLILSYNKLEEVYLGGNNLQEAGMIKIAETLRSNTTLKVFDISNNSVSDKAANSIAVTISNKVKLEKLYLNGNELQAEGIIAITTTLQSYSLKVFDVSRNDIKCTAASKIANILNRNQIEELYLGGNILQTKGIGKISSGLVYTKTLKVFDISNNGISSEAAGDIARVVSKQVQLEKLIIGRNNLQDGLVVIIKECHQTLKTLDISNNNASITAIDKIVVFLCFHTKLEKLYLGGNNLVNEKTLQTLQFCLDLTAFDISCTNMSNETKEDTKSVLSRHVAHIQTLLLAHDMKISIADEYDMEVSIDDEYDMEVSIDDEYDMEISTANKYDMEISIADKYDMCRLPPPTAELSLKHDIAKISSKCMHIYLCLCMFQYKLAS